MYLPDRARYSYLLSRPEGSDIGKAINDAMKAIEEENEDLKGVLPKTYSAFDNSLLVTLLKTFASIPMDIEGDVFGKIYEYFLGEFARAEGSKGGEFFTPTSIVRLIVEIIEPYHGRMFDPASGSAGMFVQSARFVARHKGDPNAEISIFGQEKTAETVRLAKDEPRGARPVRRHPRGQHLLRGHPRQPRQVRLCNGQSAVQRGSRG
jgi:type I restriction enzyme M protein